MQVCRRAWTTSAAFTILAAGLSLTMAGCSTNRIAEQAKGSPGSGTAAAQAPAAPAHDALLTLPRGTRLQVRLNQTIDIKHVSSGERFTGTLAQPVMAGDSVAIPAGSLATGEILVAHKRGLFKGRSMMALTLTRLDVNGTPYRIDTANLSRSKKGKGKRTAALIGGGAGMGMLIGGVATGGVGLLVGGLAGGGAGALGAAFTGNRDLSIPAESVVSFRLQNELTLMPELQANLAH
jgi:hypothetical protein